MAARGKRDHNLTQRVAASFDSSDWYVDGGDFGAAKRPAGIRRFVGASIVLFLFLLLCWLVYIAWYRKIPATYVLAFGVSEYRATEFSLNRFGKSDAEAFERLKEENAAQFVDVSPLLDRLTAPAIKDALR